MDEQLAQDLQESEAAAYVQKVLGPAEPADSLTSKTGLDVEQTLQQLVNSNKAGDCGSDELIAQMLQMQYDREYDSNLKKVEQHYNGKSKVSVSLSNYLVSPTNDEEEESNSDDNYREPKAWDSFEANEKAFPPMSGRGYVRVGNKVITKHDLEMSQRRNACRVMEFPPGIHTGDGASFDMQLSNKVFNRLKVYSRAEETRRTRLHDKSEKSTSDWAIDAKTKLMLYKMVNNGVLSEVHGIISTGKESIVLYATCPAKEIDEDEDAEANNDEEDDEAQADVVEGAVGGVAVAAAAAAKASNLKSAQEAALALSAAAAKDAAAASDDEDYECAIKVFKTSLNEFKSRDKYIKDDYRFKDRFSKPNARKVIHMWAEKEMHNLTRMAMADIACPKVIGLKKHILVLGFIGKDMKPAPKLKEVKFPQDDGDALLRSAYEQIIRGMKNLYDKCKLIHSDLSEFNVLWHENTCYFIDVSQSVEPTHPNALEFLYRDCTNICNFFGKKRLENIHSPESLFAYISGYALDEHGGPAVLNQIQDYEKNLEQLTFACSEKSYPFDYCWENSRREDEDSDQ